MVLQYCLLSRAMGFGFMEGHGGLLLDAGLQQGWTKLLLDCLGSCSAYGFPKRVWLKASLVRPLTHH